MQASSYLCLVRRLPNIQVTALVMISSLSRPSRCLSGHYPGEGMGWGWLSGLVWPPLSEGAHPPNMAAGKTGARTRYGSNHDKEGSVVSLPVVPFSPWAVWAGCPSLLHSFKLWIKGTNVVEWNNKRVTRSTVPRCEVQVVMITPGYALAPLTGTPEPANARENPGRLVLHSSDRRYG
ncbi:hypothetical protein KY289_036569 [Solanum tuberosum]|nr:hypothetical protein KY289_036569 [Solanum tuberosum]